MRFNQIIGVKENANQVLFTALIVSAILFLRGVEMRTPNLRYGQVLSDLGEDFLNKNKIGTALGYFRRAAYYNPQLPQAFHGLARIYYQRRDYSSAALYGQQAILLDPVFHEGYYILGLVYRAKQDEKQALNYFKKAYAYDPFSSIYAYDLAVSLINLGDYQRAENMVNDRKERGDLECARRIEGLMRGKRDSIGQTPGL